MKNKNFIVTFLVALFILFGAGHSYAAPTLATIQKAKAVVETARYQLPVQISPAIMLTQVSYDSEKYTLVYRYHFTVAATKPTAEAIKESKLGIIHIFKANPESGDTQLLKGGITFHYNYYSEDGTFLYAIKIRFHRLWNSYRLCKRGS